MCMNMENMNREKKMDNLELLRKIAVEKYGAETDEAVDRIVKMLIRLFIG